MSETAARASEASPDTTKMLVRAEPSASPSLPLRMRTKGQLAAIQPIVPHRRTRPNSFCASFR